MHKNESRFLALVEKCQAWPVMPVTSSTGEDRDRRITGSVCHQTSSGFSKRCCLKGVKQREGQIRTSMSFSGFHRHTCMFSSYVMYTTLMHVYTYIEKHQPYQSLSTISVMRQFFWAGMGECMLNLRGLYKLQIYISYPLSLISVMVYMAGSEDTPTPADVAPRVLSREYTQQVAPVSEHHILPKEVVDLKQLTI